MKIFTDDLGRKITLNGTPQRMISLCPCVTETLADIGAGERLVGRTRFCIHPKSALQHTKAVGGTKDVKYERVHALKPDLVIAVKEENTLEIVETLAESYPVFVLDIKTVAEGIRMIGDLGKLTDCETKANRLQSQVSAQWNEAKIAISEASVLYVIWQNPYMSVGKDTYIHDLITALGGQNVAFSLNGRYPEFTPESFAESPQKVWLSSEPFPFQEKHLAAFQAMFPRAEIRIVDGEAFSWYGTHLGKKITYLRTLFSS